MFQSSLVARMAALFFGIHLTLAASAWAGPAAGPATHPVQKKKPAVHHAPPVSRFTARKADLPRLPAHIGESHVSGKKAAGSSQVHKNANVGSRAQSQTPRGAAGKTAATGGGSGTAQHHPNGTTTLRRHDGTLTDVWPDGTIHTEHKDGSSETNHSDGSTDYYGKNRQQTGHEDADNDANGQSRSTSSTDDTKKSLPATKETSSTDDDQQSLE